MGQFENVITDEAIEVFPDGSGGQWNDSTDMNFIDVLLTELQKANTVWTQLESLQQALVPGVAEPMRLAAILATALGYRSPGRHGDV